MRKRTWIIGILIILGIYIRFDFVNALESPINPADKERISFVIKKGTGSSTIIANLEAKELIQHPLYVKAHIRMLGATKELKAGRYYLSKSMSPLEILDIIMQGKDREVVLTLLEGTTIEQMDAALANSGYFKQGAFLQCSKTCTRPNLHTIPQKGSLEGYLFPDTYFMKSDFTEQDLLNRMLTTFHNNVKDMKKAPGRSLNDAVIMASIVEREVRTDPDLPIVAGILWKRLDSKWALGADATTHYVTKRQTITAADLRMDSPYNTRNRLGLPPTAISNPGIKSLQAAFQPEASKYWFYLTDKSGRVIYGITNKEHEYNKAKHL